MSDQERTVRCSVCGKSYKVIFQLVRFFGAGSDRDWQYETLPCGHESTRYDDNNERIERMEPITESGDAP